MANKIIVVIGATGLQGKGVVNFLAGREGIHIRAVTRKPEGYSGKAHEAVKANLNDVDSLKQAFKDAYGLFFVTNSWEQGTDEIAQGKNVVAAAQAAGVSHVIWSTLPNVEAISSGAFNVPHFTNKARVDEFVNNAGFKYCTFVQPPFYFQNFIMMSAPQDKPDGTKGWVFPFDPTKKIIHMADINDLGNVVAGAFLNPDKVGNGAYLSVAAGLYSFNDIISTYKEHGKEYTFTQVPADTYATFFEGAREFAQMLLYFERYTYMGPNSDSRIAAAKEVAVQPLTSLSDWVGRNI